MLVLFDVTGAIAVIATALTITRRKPVHALLYLVVSLLAVAIEFYLLGAAFAAALEVIIYAGAIIVLFLFVVMMLIPGDAVAPVELRRPQVWMGPGLLSAALLAELLYSAFAGPELGAPIATIGPQQVGIALFGPYLIGVELVALLLLSGLVGAFHLSRRLEPAAEQEVEHDAGELEHSRVDAGGAAVRAGADWSAGSP